MRDIILATISYMINKEFSTKSKRLATEMMQALLAGISFFFLKKIAPPVAEDAGRKLGDLHHQ